MVNLPRVPRRMLTTEPTKEYISEKERAAPFALLGKALDTAGDTVRDITAGYAEEKGKKAIMYDKDGNPSYEPAPWYGGAASRAYDRSAQVAYAAASDNKMKLDLAELRQKHDGDVEGFKTAANAYLQQRAGNAPDENQRQHILTSGGAMVAGHTIGAMNDRFHRDTQVHADAIRTQLSTIDRDLTTIAETNGVNDPAYTKLWDQRRTLLNEMVKDPRMKLSQEGADADMRDRYRESQIAVIAGTTSRDFKATGDIDGASKNIEEALNSPDLNLTPDEKIKYRDRLTRIMKGSEAVRNADVEAVKNRIETAKGLLKTGDLQPDDPVISGLITTAQGLRKRALASSLDAAREIAVYTNRIKVATTAEERKALQDELNGRLEAGLRAENAIAFGEGNQSAAALIRKFEGFIPEPKWDRTALRLGYGTDTVTRADGTVEHVEAGMRVTREDAERDLQRRIGQFQDGIVRDVGQKAWTGLPDNIKAALTSVAYNYGSVASAGIADAIKTGDPETIARAVEGLKGHNNGINANRRQQEANIIRGRGGTWTGGADALDAAEAGGSYIKTRDAITKHYETTAKDILTSLKAIPAGQKPLDAELADLTEHLSYVKDDKLKKEIAEYLTVHAKTKQIMAGERNAGEGPGTVSPAVVLKSLEDAAASTGLDKIGRGILDSLRATLGKRTEAEAKDPAGLFAREHPDVAAPIGPLDTSSGAALEAGLQARQTNVTLLRNSDPTAKLGGPLNDEATEALRRAMSGPDTARAVETLKTLFGTLTPEEWHTAMTTGGLKDAVVAMSWTPDKDRAEAAYSVLQAEFKRMNQGEFEKLYGKDVRQEMDRWWGGLAYKTKEDFAEDRKQFFDPAHREARAARRTEAEAAGKAMDFREITRQFSGLWPKLADWFGPGAPIGSDGAAPPKMQNEFAREFADYIVKGGTEDFAKQSAAKALSWKYGPSKMAEGNLMEFAPEKFYPAIGDSHDWMKKEADAKIRAYLQLQTGDVARFGTTPEYDTGVPTNEPVAIKYRLTPRIATQYYGGTEGDVANGRYPTYNVVVVNPRTGQHDIMRNQNGTPYVMEFDVNKAIETSRADFTAQRLQYFTQPPRVTATGEPLPPPATEVIDTAAKRAIEARKKK